MRPCVLRCVAYIDPLLWLSNTIFRSFFYTSITSSIWSLYIILFVFPSFFFFQNIYRRKNTYTHIYIFLSVTIKSGQQILIFRSTFKFHIQYIFNLHNWMYKLNDSNQNIKKQNPYSINKRILKKETNRSGMLIMFITKPMDHRCQSSWVHHRP